MLTPHLSAKFDRAEEQLRAFERVYRAWVRDEEPYGVGRNIRVKDQTWIVLFPFVCAMVEAAGQPVSDAHAFPVELSEDAWLDKFERPDEGSKLKGLGSSTKAFALVKSAQPYHAGQSAKDHAIAVLEDMWNRDKHRTLNIYPDPTALLNIFEWSPKSVIPLYHSAPLARFVFPPQNNLEVHVKHPLALEIAFGDAKGERRPLRKTVAYARRVVERAALVHE